MKTKGLILPTFELVTECMPYDKVFSQFLEGGVKDVVLESIVARSFYKYYAEVDQYRSGLLSSMLHSFEDHCTQEWGDAHMEPGTTFMDRYLAKVAIIEFVVQEIEENTRLMLNELLGGRREEIEPKLSRWHGRDLIVFLRNYAGR